MQYCQEITVTFWNTPPINTGTLPGHHSHTACTPPAYSIPRNISHHILNTPNSIPGTLPGHHSHTACTLQSHCLHTTNILDQEITPHSQHSPPPPNSIPGTLSGYHSYSTLNTPTQYCHSKIPLSGNVFTNWSIKKKLFNSTHLNYITLQHKQVRLTIGNKSKEGFLDL